MNRKKYFGKYLPSLSSYRKKKMLIAMARKASRISHLLVIQNLYAVCTSFYMYKLNIFLYRIIMKVLTSSITQKKSAALFTKLVQMNQVSCSYVSNSNNLNSSLCSCNIIYLTSRLCSYKLIVWFRVCIYTSEIV